eukprot:PhF_6_TR18945/c0_g1_i5/m.27765
MPIYIAVQVSVALHRLRNVDLLSQGLYRTVTSLTTITSGGGEGEEEEERNARVVSIQHTKRNKITSGRYCSHSDFKELLDANSESEILSKNSWAATRAFYVRYENQVEPLTDVVTFEFDVPLELAFSLNKDKVFLHFDLYHIQKEHLRPETPARKLTLQDYCFVQRRSLPLFFPTLCIHTYLPVMFHEWYCAMLSTTVHSCIVGFNFSDPNVDQFNDEQYQLLCSHVGMNAHVLSNLLDLIGDDVLFSEKEDEEREDSLVANNPHTTQQQSGALSPHVHNLHDVTFDMTHERDDNNNNNTKDRWCDDHVRNHPEIWYNMESLWPPLHHPTISFSSPTQRAAYPMSTLIANTWRLWDHFLNMTLPTCCMTVCASLRSAFYERGHRGIEQCLLPKETQRTIPPLSDVFFYPRLEKCVLHLEGGGSSHHPLQLVPTPKLKSRRRHGVVLVHGYQAKATDFRFIRRFLHVLYPDVIVHIATSITPHPHASFQTLASLLSDEVRSFIVEEDIQTLSFIGHSMGGIVIRRMLLEPSMAAFLPMMHSYISLNCPHLGASRSKSLRRLASVVSIILPKQSCVHSLLVKDNVLQHLADNDVLGVWFPNIILVGCEGDMVVEESSALAVTSPPSGSQDGPLRDIEATLRKKKVSRNGVSSGVVRKKGFPPS